MGMRKSHNKLILSQASIHLLQETFLKTTIRYAQDFLPSLGYTKYSTIIEQVSRSKLRWTV